MAGTKHVLSFNGFDLLLEQIKEADGSIQEATTRALESSGNLLTQNFRAGAQQRGLPTDTLITPKVTWNGNRASVVTGFELGTYDSKNMGSGYKVLFTEFGTKERQTKTGANRGKITPNPFIRPAIDANKKTIKKAQEKALERMLKGLKN